VQGVERLVTPVSWTMARARCVLVVYRGCVPFAAASEPLSAGPADDDLPRPSPRLP
jgi:hypothetical protein